MRARVCAYVLALASPSLYPVLRPGQASRASASVSGRVFARPGVAPVPGLQLCVRWDGTYCARGGCRAGLRLLHWWHAVWFDVCVVSSLAACKCPDWGIASLHLGQCGWPALVGWRFLCACAFDGFLLWFRIAYACPTTESLCNIGMQKQAGNHKRHTQQTPAHQRRPLHMHVTNTPHTHHTAPCATEALATDTAAGPLPRTRSRPAQCTYN